MSCFQHGSSCDRGLAYRRNPTEDSRQRVTLIEFALHMYFQEHAGGARRAHRLEPHHEGATSRKPEAVIILGIESSCDETAAAVLRDGRYILSNVIASQVAIHGKYGGVVPELASRHHLENIVPIVNAALQEAGITRHEIDGIAVTQGPGLVGSLLVGVNYAKALAFSLGKPFVAVNHLEGHVYSVPLELARSEDGRGIPLTDWKELFPALCLIVSGGHTSLYWVEGLGLDSNDGNPFQLVGRTRDDAAGEAFDKVAKLLHLGYPGGPIIDRLSEKGDPEAIDFPLSKISDGKLDFSFSGIKTAVLRYAQVHLQTELSLLSTQPKQEGFHNRLPPVVYDLVASFQRTVVDMLFQVAGKLRSVVGQDRSWCRGVWLATAS